MSTTHIFGHGYRDGVCPASSFDRGACAYIQANSFLSVPQKRKVAGGKEGTPPETAQESDTPATATDPLPPKNEYEDGHVTCEACGEEISFRDEGTGGFTVKHWDLHRQQW